MMKVILVDAVNAFFLKGSGVFKEMHDLLEAFPNRKIVLTNANDEEMETFGLTDVPYELFTCKHDPYKTDPVYYETMLKHFGLKPEDVVYFEHNEDAVQSARSVGINTFHYDKDKRDLIALKQFLDEALD